MIFESKKFRNDFYFIMINSSILGLLVLNLSLLNNSIILFLSIGVFFLLYGFGYFIILLYYFFTFSENDYRLIDLEDFTIWYSNNPLIYLLITFGIITIGEEGGLVIFISLIYLLTSIYMFISLYKSGYTERDRLFRFKTRRNFLIVAIGFMIFGFGYLMLIIFNSVKSGITIEILISILFYNFLGTPYVVYESLNYGKEKKDLHVL